MTRLWPRRLLNSLQGSNSSLRLPTVSDVGAKEPGAEEPVPTRLALIWNLGESGELAPLGMEILLPVLGLLPFS